MGCCLSWSSTTCLSVNCPGKAQTADIKEMIVGTVLILALIWFTLVSAVGFISWNQCITTACLKLPVNSQWTFHLSLHESQVNLRAGGGGRKWVGGRGGVGVMRRDSSGACWVFLRISASSVHVRYWPISSAGHKVNMTRLDRTQVNTAEAEQHTDQSWRAVLQSLNLSRISFLSPLSLLWSSLLLFPSGVF